MTAQPIAPALRGSWGPDPLRQRLADNTIGHRQTSHRLWRRLADHTPNAFGVSTYDPVDGGREPAVEPAEELVLAKPFEIRLRDRDIAK